MKQKVGKAGLIYSAQPSARTGAVKEIQKRSRGSGFHLGLCFRVSDVTVWRLLEN